MSSHEITGALVNYHRRRMADYPSVFTPSLSGGLVSTEQRFNKICGRLGREAKMEGSNPAFHCESRKFFAQKLASLPLVKVLDFGQGL